ncbi:hypothetical protein MHO82_23090 [Vibrio sp. Of7-15]|uniref:hypothetical protein n=1 Tax=Vibrio sp. Of7-15 TaxID=2724879 RepID=UPI001EF1FA75|nr:hypothetical protein [Vibrio sp. Of7-15]MCG7499756.1 hypothetical protein [Vibrio sp. Of7-15]
MKKLHSLGVTLLSTAITGCGLFIEKESVWINTSGEQASSQEVEIAMVNCQYRERELTLQQLSNEMKSKKNIDEETFNNYLDTSSQIMRDGFECMREEGLHLENRPKATNNSTTS